MINVGDITGNTPLTNLNADKLDGKHLNENGVPYLRGFRSNGRVTQLANTTSFDSIDYNSVYNIDKNHPDMPTPLDGHAWAFLETLVHTKTTSWRTQILTGMNSGYEKTLIRIRRGTTWGNWVEQTSEDNILDHIKAVDGSGSGIDADMLDGLQGSSYARANGNTSKTFYVASATHDNHAVKKGQLTGSTPLTNLNADKLDGKHLNENGVPYLRGFKSNGKLTTYTATDLTNIDYNSDYFIEHNRTDTPHNSTYFLKARMHPSGYYKTYELNSNTKDNTASFVKGETNGVKGEWQVKTFKNACIFFDSNTVIDMNRSFGIYSFSRVSEGVWQVDLNMNWGNNNFSMCGVGTGDNVVGIESVSVVNNRTRIEFASYDLNSTNGDTDDHSFFGGVGVWFYATY